MESLGVPLLHPMNVNLEQELDRLFRFWDCPPGGSAESLRVNASAIRALSATPDTVPFLENVTSFSVGINCVDLPKCCERRIRVTNTPDMLTDDIADLAVCLTISALRKTPQADRYVRAGLWKGQGGLHTHQGHALFELIHWAVCSFKSAYYGVVEKFSGKDVKFLIGDIEASQGAFQYFGLKEDQAPVILMTSSKMVT